ncbi:receptor-type tyrosine-protein phosphatase epsilon-like isoform X2 [Mercenaria mercenaria]|uniref:receptor-type tyrosine-protein phosphatase epsilon-like isoform X2 n=1 Tax=Mercenaria mercenaria TaxID=6596 RepID=UPI00234F071B|nr:receptor-type tyrosine-protein phosphatase epsilon-like isoform X2 [Mercenaria mercenaria]
MLRNPDKQFLGLVLLLMLGSAAQTGLNGESMSVTIGAAAGGGLFLVIIIVVIVVVLLLRRRGRSDKSKKKELVEINDNTDNSAVTYSEIVATGVPLQQTDADAVYAKPNKLKKSVDRVISSNESSSKQTPTNSSLPLQQTDADAVYAMPNKPKKSVDRVKSSSESSSAQMPSNPNYEKPPTGNLDIVNKENCRKPPIVAKPAHVYDNTAIRTSVTTHKSSVHLDDAALEIEEDIDSIMASSKTKSVTLADGLNVTESDTYYNVTAVKKRNITLDSLPDFVSKKTKAEFAEEFKQLPPGLIKPYVDSQKRVNLSKNRYKGIYPYDETRVVLKEGDSDYINASYIDGYNKRKAYIASIGPTFKYMGDMSAFWIMVWQEKVGKIVMLTKLDEGGAPKCDQYWPEKDFSLPYASIQVTCQSEESYADYTIRSFTIQKGSEKRKIVQVHFTAWPDKGTPDDVTSLIEFRQKVISTKTELEGPILVHCSAGIGRTGTYIALDSLTEEGEAEGEVDIYAFVRNMREQRVNMVQTAEQYQYLHNALVHTLTFDSKAVEASKFDKYMTSHTDDHLGEKFEKLQASVEQRSDDEVDAVKRNQALRNKNRVGADIPGDRNRPKLYLERKLGSSDYINAVYVNSYTTINRYLVAQTPLPDTVVDFLTLLVQEKVSCIVSMETDSVDDKTIGAFYPADNQTLKKGTFTVKSKREKDTEQYVLRKLEIAHKGKSGTEVVTIPHIQFTHWNEHKNIPEEPAKFVQFVKDVEMKYGGNKSRGPILVHCLTGAEKSGLFCVVSNLLEKTQIDQETSVVNAVRQIKYRRHMSVPNKDQYIFCHQCVNEYLRTFDIYSNFELKT